MIGFWIVSAAFIAAALLFLLPPLLARSPKRAVVGRRAATVSIYQDELSELDADLKADTITPEQHQHSRNELQRRMLEDVSAESNSASAEHGARGRWAAWVVGVVFPVFAVLLYLQLGSPDALSPGERAGLPLGHSTGEITEQQILSMVEGLARRLEKNPQDARGWVMLGRSYTALGRFPDATVAYAKATELVANDAQLWSDYADVQAMANGKRLQGKPEEFIRKALEVDPNNHKALALAGTAAFEARNYPAAVEYWERLLKLLPADSEGYQSVFASISEARSLAVPAGESGVQPAQAKGVIRGAVSISPALSGRIDPGATLFVFARAVNGPKMPLAVQRLSAKDLPVRFSLDDSMAMTPELKLSNFSEVVVGARISKSGNAASQSGDLQGVVSPVKMGMTNVEIVIHEIVP